MKNKIIYPNSRRKFLKYSLAYTVAGGIYPNSSLALKKKDIFSLIQLHPVRFIAGLVFSIFEAVVVELAKDVIVDLLYHGKKPTNINLSNIDNFNAIFKYPNYKASAIILGVSDYESHKKRKLKLLLKGERQIERHKNIISYLRDEKLRIKIFDREYSRLVGVDTTPDDLFTLDYIQIDSHKIEHYSNLIKLTGTKAFNNWSI